MTRREIADLLDEAVVHIQLAARTADDRGFPRVAAIHDARIAAFRSASALMRETCKWRESSIFGIGNYITDHGQTPYAKHGDFCPRCGKPAEVVG